MGRWVTADYAAKRQMLEIVFLNFTLVNASLCYQMAKPFDALAKGLLVSSNRDDKTAIELFVSGVGVWEARLQRLVGKLADGK
jgi:hypothetical protein